MHRLFSTLPFRVAPYDRHCVRPLSDRDGGWFFERTTPGHGACVTVTRHTRPTSLLPKWCTAELGRLSDRDGAHVPFHYSPPVVIQIFPVPEICLPHYLSDPSHRSSYPFFAQNMSTGPRLVHSATHARIPPGLCFVSIRPPRVPLDCY
jgi:hypothetical protein